MSAIELTMDDVRRDRAAVHAWLRAHDLDPNETAPGIVVREGKVTAKVWLRNADGARYIERESDNDAAHRVATVPLVAPVPAGLGTVIE